MRAELAAHVGGNPTAAQQALIDTIAMLWLRLSLLDEKVARGEVLRGSEDRSYVSMTSALARSVRGLGLHAPSKAALSFDDLWSRLQEAGAP